MSKDNRKSINIKVSTALHEVLLKKSKEEHRTISNYVEKTLIDATNFKN